MKAPKKPTADLPAMPAWHEALNDRSYWKRPRKAAFGDAAQERLYQSVGTALTTWEATEVVLGMLFRVFIESRSPAAARAYGMTASATGRADALLEAGKVFLHRHEFPAETCQTFKKTITAYKNASALRNDIAHGVVMWTRIEEGKISGYVLIAPSYNSRRTLIFYRSALGSEPDVKLIGLQHIQNMVESSTYCYSTEEAMLIAFKFIMLGSAVTAFFFGLPKEFLDQSFSD